MLLKEFLCQRVLQGTGFGLLWSLSRPGARGFCCPGEDTRWVWCRCPDPRPPLHGPIPPRGLPAPAGRLCSVRNHSCKGQSPALCHPRGLCWGFWPGGSDAHPGTGCVSAQPPCPWPGAPAVPGAPSSGDRAIESDGSGDNERRSRPRPERKQKSACWWPELRINAREPTLQQAGLSPAALSASSASPGCSEPSHQDHFPPTGALQVSVQVSSSFLLSVFHLELWLGDPGGLFQPK